MRPKNGQLGIAGMLILSSFAAVVACQHTPSRTTSPGAAAVGPVALSDLAALITDVGGLPAQTRPVKPFTIIVTALALPTDGQSVRCDWNERSLGSFQVLYASPEAERAARAEIDEFRDAGARERDIADLMNTRVATDGSRPETAAHFDEQLRATRAPLERVPGSGRTYWTAFLCGEGDRAALLLDSFEEPANGSGFILVLRRGVARWELVETQGTWII